MSVAQKFVMPLCLKALVIAIGHLVFWGTVAWSGDHSNTIRAEIDGVEAPWVMSGQSGGPIGTWRGDATTAQIKLAARSVTGDQTLSIAFYLFEPGITNHATEVDIVLTLPGDSGAYVTKGHGDGSIIDLQTVEIADNTMVLTGQFAVQLFYTDDFGVTLDQDRTRTVKGQFDTRLALQ